MGVTDRQTEKFNRRIDAATDLPALEEETTQIRASLTSRRQDSPAKQSSAGIVITHKVDQRPARVVGGATFSPQCWWSMETP